MKKTTGYDFQGYTITEYYDVIFDEMLMGLGFGKSILSSLDNFASSFMGTEATVMVDKLNNTKTELRDRVCRKAERLGANALISIDSYHYFAGKEGFFVNNILPYIKKGGIALIVIPGIKSEYAGKSEELLTAWAGDEAYMFQSTEFWKKIIGEHEDIEEVRTWEMSLFDLAWQEWFDTKHEYALNDKKYFDSMIKPFTNFVGIMVRKK